jgi:hypothetical protein
MAKWQLGGIVVFVVLFGLTVILTGQPVYILSALLLAAVVFGYATVNWAMTKRVASKHDSLEDAMSDETLPTSHLIPDDSTPAGDTPEAHDEINPHDLPAGHPGRQEAEHRASEEPRDDGARTTRGDDELARAAPKRTERLEPSGEQRGD